METKSAAKESGRRIKTRLSLKRKSRKQRSFSGQCQIRLVMSPFPSSIQTVTVGSGVVPDHAIWSQEACFRIFASKLADSKIARGLYHRSGIHLHFVRRKWHPAPKVEYLIVAIITKSSHKL